MAPGALTVAVLVLLTFAGARPVAGSPQSRLGTRQGYALAYDLNFAAAHATLADAARADPSDPAPHRAIAAITWMEILFLQGVATFEAFTGEISKSDVVRPAVPVVLSTRFSEALGRASILGDRQLAARADPDAHYQVGATALLSALYGSTVEGRVMRSLRQGRQAVAAMSRAHAGGVRDAGLVLGLSQYTISTLSWPARTMARLSGLTGHRKEGLRLLEEAADAGNVDTRSDALLLLMIIDTREARPLDAIKRLVVLQQWHPRNRLLRLNHGAAALAARQWDTAEQVLSPGIATRAWESPPTVLGEPAMWWACVGTARVQGGQHAAARENLSQGLASSPRAWVRGRIHAQLGAIALAAGDIAGARREFDAARRHSLEGGDRLAADAARQQLAALRP